ncbi:hypothetical protein [Mycobacterium tuberculosis]|uniref:hypothetical protein n=1 Tax=Mycobacterium tuberculosis TaxID=1773 RepID=UPI00049A1B9C|nr:hypothetical protein [Mycobacterium tuberculosis]AIB50314.1 hypothetical protein MTBK_37700 [Mycobacterium tuberculosis K]
MSGADPPTRRAFGQMARAATGWVSVSGQFAVAADTCRCEGTLFAVDPETHVANHNRCDIVGRLRDERPNTLRSVRRGDEVRMATWPWI